MGGRADARPGRDRADPGLFGEFPGSPGRLRGLPTAGRVDLPALAAEVGRQLRRADLPLLRRGLTPRPRGDRLSLPAPLDLPAPRGRLSKDARPDPRPGRRLDHPAPAAPPGTSGLVLMGFAECFFLYMAWYSIADFFRLKVDQAVMPPASVAIVEDSTVSSSPWRRSRSSRTRPSRPSPRRRSRAWRPGRPRSSTGAGMSITGSTSNPAGGTCRRKRQDLRFGGR